MIVTIIITKVTPAATRTITVTAVARVNSSMRTTAIAKRMDSRIRDFITTTITIAAVAVAVFVNAARWAARKEQKPLVLRTAVTDSKRLDSLNSSFIATARASEDYHQLMISIVTAAIVIVITIAAIDST